MQVPVAQPFLWPQMVPPTDQYVTPHNPSHNMVVPQLLGQETLVPVPIVLKNGWLVQGMQQTSSHPATSYLPQPLQYVTVQPRFKMEGGGVEKLITTEQQQQFLTRPILIPRGPATRGNHVTTCGRSLRGNSYATRRQSEENGDETPVKKSSFDTRICLKKDVGVHKDRDDYILQSIEYYFSDENLAKNAYLLKQVLQEDGYISIKRVAALKRVKLYTRDDQVVTQCIRRSDKLELNEDGTMVRRKQPLPANIEPPRFVRSVIAINLPMSSPTIESVTSLFAAYGDLTQVRILKPGKKLPSYLTDYQAWIPDLGRKYCALVEFECQEEAQSACREINMKNRTSESLRVALLKPGARLRRTLYRKYKGPDNCQENSSTAIFEDSNPRQKQPQHFDTNHHFDACGSGSSSETEVGTPQEEKTCQDVTENDCQSGRGCCLTNYEESQILETNTERDQDSFRTCSFLSSNSFITRKTTMTETD